MKKNKNFTIILAAALTLVGIIVITIVVGLSLPKHPDIIQGQAETTDYRLSSKVPARVCEIRVQEGDHVRRGIRLSYLKLLISVPNCRKQKPPMPLHRHRNKKHRTVRAKSRYNKPTKCGRKHVQPWR